MTDDLLALVTATNEAVYKHLFKGIGHVLLISEERAAQLPKLHVSIGFVVTDDEEKDWIFDADELGRSVSHAVIYDNEADRRDEGTICWVVAPAVRLEANPLRIIAAGIACVVPFGEVLSMPGVKSQIATWKGPG